MYWNWITSFFPLVSCQILQYNIVQHCSALDTIDVFVTVYSYILEGDIYQRLTVNKLSVPAAQPSMGGTSGVQGRRVPLNYSKRRTAIFPFSLPPLITMVLTLATPSNSQEIFLHVRWTPLALLQDIPPGLGT